MNMRRILLYECLARTKWFFNHSAIFLAKSNKKTFKRRILTYSISYRARPKINSRQNYEISEIKKFHLSASLLRICSINFVRANIPISCSEAKNIAIRSRRFLFDFVTLLFIPTQNVIIFHFTKTKFYNRIKANVKLNVVCF